MEAVCPCTASREAVVPEEPQGKKEAIRKQTPGAVEEQSPLGPTSVTLGPHSTGHAPADFRFCLEQRSSVEVYGKPVPASGPEMTVTPAACSWCRAVPSALLAPCLGPHHQQIVCRLTHWLGPRLKDRECSGVQDCPHRSSIPSVACSRFPPGNPRPKAALSSVPAGFLTAPPSPRGFCKRCC